MVSPRTKTRVRSKPHTERSVSISSKTGPASARTNDRDDGDLSSVDISPRNLTPVCCMNDRELTKEVDNIHRVLSEQGEWTQRKEALKRLQGLVVGCSSMEAFCPLTVRLRDQLATQIQDLRSAIVREVCTVVYLLARALGTEFETVGASLVPVLFKCTFVSIAVIAESGYQCIRAIVRHCQSQRVMGVLMEQFVHKNSSLRWRCAQVLLLALQTWSPQILERHVDALESNIKLSMEDAGGDCRACGRKCFWAFFQAFEERGSRLYARLDGQKQRLLDSERPSFECIADSRSVSVLSSRCPSEIGDETQSISLSMDADVTELEEHAFVLTAAPDARRQSTPSKCQRRPGSVPAKTEETRDNRSPRRPVRPPGAPTGKASSGRAKPSGGSKSARSRLSVTVPVRSTSASPTFASNSAKQDTVTVRTATAPPSPVTMSAREVSAPSNAGSPTTGVAEVSSSLSGSSSKLPTQIPTPAISVGASFRRRKELQGSSSQDGSEILSGACALPQPGRNARASSQSRSIPPSPETESREVRPNDTAEERMCNMVNSSQDAAGRADALRDLALFIEQGEGDAWEDVTLDTLLASLGDVPAVVSWALTAIRALLVCRPSGCAASLNLILMSLFAVRRRIGDTDVVRSCLAECTTHQEPKTLLATTNVLLNTRASNFGLSAEAVRFETLTLLETSMIGLPRFRTYLAGGGPAINGQRPPMCWLLEDLLCCPEGTETSSALRRATSRALHALFLQENDVFLSAAASLQTPSQHSLCSVLAHLVPELADKISLQRTREPAEVTASQSMRRGTPTRGMRKSPSTDTMAQASANFSKPRPGTPRKSDGDDAGKLAALVACYNTSMKGTLRALAVAARTEGARAWERHFGRVLVLVCDALKQTEVEQRGIRDTALLCLQELVAHQAGFFNDFAEVVVTKLFEAYRLFGGTEKQTAASIDLALVRLLDVIEPLRSMDILLPVVSAEGALLQVAARLLPPVLQKMHPKLVEEHLDVLLPGLVTAFGSDNSEVRKAAVFCLVEIFLILGEDVMPFFTSELSPSQMKLVMIYITRQQKEREELMAV